MPNVVAPKPLTGAWVETIALNAYRSELGMLLKASTLTPGRYQPSDAVRAGTHAAVLVGGRPVILCGPYDDDDSVSQAQALAASEFANMAVRVAGHGGTLSAGVVTGDSVAWTDNMAAIVGKPSGQVEDGSGDGPLIAIVLDDPHAALAVALCVTTETARVFDPTVPELDDGRTLSDLARAAR